MQPITKLSVPSASPPCASVTNLVSTSPRSGQTVCSSHAESCSTNQSNYTQPAMALALERPERRHQATECQPTLTGHFVCRFGTRTWTVSAASATRAFGPHIGTGDPAKWESTGVTDTFTGASKQVYQISIGKDPRCPARISSPQTPTKTACPIGRYAKNKLNELNREEFLSPNTRRVEVVMAACERVEMSCTLFDDTFPSARRVPPMAQAAPRAQMSTSSEHSPFATTQVYNNALPCFCFLALVFEVSPTGQWSKRFNIEAVNIQEYMEWHVSHSLSQTPDWYMDA